MECKKTRFSKHAANVALKFARKNRRPECRSYFCNDCHCYHLTSSARCETYDTAETRPL